MNILTADSSLSSGDPGGLAGTVAPPVVGATAFALQLGQAFEQLGDGQNLAAAVQGLRATPLSPTLQVLTPFQSFPDPQTLADFAKRQGIDEAAVHWLFQSTATASAETPDTESPGANAPALIAPSPSDAIVALPLSAPVVDGAIGQVDQNTSSLLGDAGGDSAMGMPSMSGAICFDTSPQAQSAPSLGQPAPPPSSVSVLMQRAGSVDISAAKAAGTEAGDALSALHLQVDAPSTAAALAPGGDGAGEGVVPQAAVARESSPGMGLAALVATAAALVQGSHDRSARQASPMAGTEAGMWRGEGSHALPPLLKNTPVDTVARWQRELQSPGSTPGRAAPYLDVLELDTELQADLRQWLDTAAIEGIPMEASPSQQPATSAPVLTQPAAATRSEAVAPSMVLASHAAERAEDLYDLAQRVGQALGQRMVSMIERGHWHVRFMLKPQQLGEIEVDLRMRLGEIEAAFRAANPFTRDLLQEGLPRLREVMSSAGMDVASAHVGDGQARRHGGNPTPSHKASTGGTVETQAAAGTVPQALIRVAPAGGPGWDVMV